MPLMKTLDILKMAERHETSVIAFNAFDTNTISAVVRGAQRVKKPVIVMLYPTMNKYISFAAFAAEVRALAEESDMPVGLHLDHCASEELIMHAIDVGFTSVMADGSMLPFDENVAFTRKIVEAAHPKGVDVEGELGVIGRIGVGEETDYTSKDLYTTADQAEAFVARTGADSLAIAIGSAHGFYTHTPKLDLDRLVEINQRIKTPLVLHGGSGIPDDQLERAFRLGINKFNVGTEFIHLNMTLTRDALCKDDSSSLAYIAPVREGLTEYIMKKLSLTQMVCE